MAGKRGYGRAFSGANLETICLVSESCGDILLADFLLAKQERQPEPGADVGFKDFCSAAENAAARCVTGAALIQKLAPALQGVPEE